MSFVVGRVLLDTEATHAGKVASCYHQIYIRRLHLRQPSSDDSVDLSSCTVQTGLLQHHSREFQQSHNHYSTFKILRLPAKLVLGRYRPGHITDGLHQLHLRPLVSHGRIRLKVCLFVHVLHGEHWPYLLALQVYITHFTSQLFTNVRRAVSTSSNLLFTFERICLN